MLCKKSNSVICLKNYGISVKTQNKIQISQLLCLKPRISFLLFGVILEDAQCGGKNMGKKQKKKLLEVQVLLGD